jgi:hypothetical protein
MHRRRGHPSQAAPALAAGLAGGDLETLGYTRILPAYLGFPWVSQLGFPWFSLDSLVRIMTFQWVTAVPQWEFFSRSSSRKVRQR